MIVVCFWRAVVAVLALFCAQEVLFADDGGLQDLYKKIADGLIGIRKDYPTTQPKVYSLLDQVEKLYTDAKNADQKSAKYKEQLKVKIAENAVLKTELNSLKSESTTIKKAIETTKNEVDQKLEEERLRVDELLQERKLLQAKITELEGQKKVAENEADKEIKLERSGRKKDLMALAAQKLDHADQPSLRRISTSEPSSPR